MLKMCSEKKNYPATVSLSLLLILFGEIFFIAESFQLNILHTNDMHSRFVENCVNKNTSQEKCYGGFSRLATIINEHRSKNTTIFLNAGDTYQGTFWFRYYKWKIVARGLEILKPDAICLGNHEFDNGVDGLIPFLKNTSYPVLAANLDLSDEPELNATGIKKSVVLNKEGHKIGIIGYLTNETKITSSVGKVKFLDEVTEIQHEANKLKKAGVEILIALGHSGYEEDKKIAEQVDGIDVVIGGHSHTFLYSGNEKDYDKPEGPYPTKIKQKTGNTVYVVQAAAYTKYIGHVILDFDEAKGKVTSITGNPILVDDRFKEDPNALAEFKKWRLPLQEEEQKEVGSSLVFLDGNSKTCRVRECNLGNLITDAMVDYITRQYDPADKWINTPIAIFLAGDIRGSIDRSPNQKITMGEIFTTLPFDDQIVIIDIPGKVLLQVLEWSVNKGNRSSGAFLQLSGIKVTYNLSKSLGSRVVSAMARCCHYKTSEFEKIDQNRNYTVVAGSYLFGGGDGYTMLTNLKWKSINITAAEALAEYLKIHSPVSPGIELRINFEINFIDTSSSNNFLKPSLFVMSIIIFLILALQ